MLITRNYRHKFEETHILIILLVLCQFVAKAGEEPKVVDLAIGKMIERITFAFEKNDQFEVSLKEAFRDFGATGSGFDFNAFSETLARRGGIHLIQDAGYGRLAQDLRIHGAAPPASVTIFFNKERSGRVAVGDCGISFRMKQIPLDKSAGLFRKGSVVAKVLGLKNLNEKLTSSALIEQIDVDYGDVSGNWTPIRYFGFTVKVYAFIQSDHTRRYVIYNVASGLDDQDDYRNNRKIPASGKIMIPPPIPIVEGMVKDFGKNTMFWLGTEGTYELKSLD